MIRSSLAKFAEGGAHPPAAKGAAAQACAASAGDAARGRANMHATGVPYQVPYHNLRLRCVSGRLGPRASGL